MGDIKPFTGVKCVENPKATELCRRLGELIHEYDGELTYLEVLGALSVVNVVISNGSQEE